MINLINLLKNGSDNEESSCEEDNYEEGLNTTNVEIIQFPVGKELAKIKRQNKKLEFQREVEEAGGAREWLMNRIASICNLPNGQVCFEKELAKYGFERGTGEQEFVPIFKLVGGKSEQG
jgi:hypothetical protein